MIPLDIQDHFGATFAMCVFVGVAIVSGIIWLSIWLYKVISKNKEIERRVASLPCSEHSATLDRIVATETKVDALPCAEHLEQIRKHDEGHNAVLTHLSSIDTTLMFLQKGIDGINQILQKSDRNSAGGYTQTNSPLSITPKGYEMVERLGVQQMFDCNWHRIEPLIENGVESRNPYDIQQFCIQQAVVFPEKFLSDAELNKIKLDAYNSGEPLISYLRVIAVMARDRYFKENNIDVSEVDANDPTHK